MGLNMNDDDCGLGLNIKDDCGLGVKKIRLMVVWWLMRKDHSLLVKDQG